MRLIGWIILRNVLKSKELQDMKITIRTNNATWLNAAFIFWLISEIMFSYSVISRLALLLFVGLTFVITHKICWNYGVIWYGLFVLWSAVNIWTDHAVNRTIASEMEQTVLLNLLFLFAFVSYCRYIGDVGKILQIYKWVVFVFCVPCFVGGISTVLSGSRLTFLGINENSIAMFAAYAFIIFLSELLDNPKEARQSREYLVIAFLLITVLLTGSRKGLIIPVVGIYVLICFRHPKKFVVYTLTLGIAAMVLMYLLLNVPVLYKVIGYRVEPVLQFLRGQAFEEASLDSRTDYIRLGWEQSKNSPFWGHGLDCFRTMRYAYGTYSHCNYVELAYSLGWVGVVIYYIPYIYAFFQIPHAIKRNKEQTALLLALLIPYVICDYFMVSYFTRTSLIIPAMAMLVLKKEGTGNEIKTIS